jgi:hypothetical protein
MSQMVGVQLKLLVSTYTKAQYDERESILIRNKAQPIFGPRLTAITPGLRYLTDI